MSVTDKGFRTGNWWKWLTIVYITHGTVSNDVAEINAIKSQAIA